MLNVAHQAKLNIAHISGLFLIMLPPEPEIEPGNSGLISWFCEEEVLASRRNREQKSIPRSG